MSALQLSTVERGFAASLSVRLATSPLADVDVTLRVTDLTEGRLRPPGAGWVEEDMTLSFTPDDWAVPQVVEVLPQDDALVDGTITYAIEVTVTSYADPAYAALPPFTIQVANADDEVPGLSFAGFVGSLLEQGTWVDLPVRLAVAPSAPVIVPVTVSDPTEGLIRGGDSPDTLTSTLNLTFTPADWSTLQVVRIQGADDATDDGDQTWQLTFGPSSGAPEYASLLPRSFSITTVDNETAGLVLGLAASPLVTSEAGTTAAFTVRLSCAPVGALTVPVTSGAPGEGLLTGAGQVGVETLHLTFDETNWSTLQTVTITGQDDAGAPVPGDNVAYDVTVGPPSGDPAYEALAARAVNVVNTDDDTALVIVPAAGGAPLQTRETGVRTATFTVAVNRPPIGDLVIPVSTSAPGEVRVQGGDSPVSPVAALNVVFTAADWLNPKTVTVVGQPDFVADGNQTAVITLGTPTGDPAWAGVAPQQVDVVNVDTDAPGYTVSTQSLSHTEGGVVATFTVVLNVKPVGDVVIPVASGDPTEGLLSGGDSGGAFVSSLNLTFTPLDWGTRQTVQVQGQTDHVVDATQYYEIAVGPTASLAGTPYDGLAGKKVNVTSLDGDAAGLVLTGTTLVTSEAGGTASFGVRLSSIPSADVLVRLVVDDATEALLSAGGSPASEATLVFSPAAWDVPQTVTVTGQDDAIVDGLRAYKVAIGPTESADGHYSGLTGEVTGTTTDDEVGSPEGTVGAPVPLAPGTPRYSTAGSAEPSYYVVNLAPGAPFAVTIADGSVNVTITVDDNGNYANGILCAATTVWAKGSWRCSGTVPAGGEVHVRVSTSTAAGAGFILYAGTWRTFASTDVPIAIPDVTSLGAATSALGVVDGPALVTNLRVRFTIVHPRAGDLVVELQSPAGDVVPLTDHVGGTSPGFSDVVFMDGAASLGTLVVGTEPITGTWDPWGFLSLDVGKPANGTWRLNVRDGASGTVGTLEAWAIEMY